MKKLFLVLPVLVLIAAGCNQPASTAQNPPPVQTDSTTPPQEQDETAGWKTYADTQNGFEFKYPSNWNIVNEYTTRIRSASAQAKLDDYTLKCNKDKQFCDPNYIVTEQVSFSTQFGLPAASDLKETTNFNGIKFDRYSDGGQVEELITYVTTRNGINYSFFEYKRNEIYLKQILSTFKFTN